jgi:hypothetical protein
MIPPSSSSLLSFLSCYAVDRQARTHFSSSFNSSIRSKMLVARTTLIFVLVTLSTVVAKTPDNVSSRLMIHVSSLCIRALTWDGVQTEKDPSRVIIAYKSVLRATRSMSRVLLLCFHRPLDDYLPPLCFPIDSIAFAKQP